MQDAEKCNLKTLSLNDNCLDSRLLTNLIRTNASLTDIGFSGNDITDVSMRTIAGHLLTSYCLCKLRAIKCNAIEIALTTQTLDLTGQTVDPVVILLLGAILRYNGSLAVVKLAKLTPPFDAEGAKALQENAV